MLPNSCLTRPASTCHRLAAGGAPGQLDSEAQGGSGFGGLGFRVEDVGFRVRV